MPGAGKSLASSVMKTRGIPVFVSGDIIRAEARKRKLKFTRKNLGELMLQIRKEEGMGAVARRLVPLVESARGELVVYEGARSVEEVDELRRKYRVVTIAINASRQARFQRLQRRRRSDRPRGWADFSERDNRELGVGIAKLIALADRTVENEDSKDDLKRRTRRLLQVFLNPKKSSLSRRLRSSRLRILRKFRKWLREASRKSAPLPQTMTLATATKSGRPSARTILLRELDDSGFVFYTNYSGRKGKELAENPRAAIVFYWPRQSLQVRVEGRVVKVASNESETYFRSRPRDSQLSAWASHQSRVIRDRRFLEERVER